jgi:cytochrome P450
MDPAFKYKKLCALVPVFAGCTRKLIDKWEQNLDKPIKVEEGLTEVTLDAIGE